VVPFNPKILSNNFILTWNHGLTEPLSKQDN